MISVIFNKVIDSILSLGPMWAVFIFGLFGFILVAGFVCFFTHFPTIFILFLCAILCLVCILCIGVFIYGVIENIRGA